LRREVSRDLEALLNSIALESVSTRQGLPGPQVDPELWYSRVTRRTIDEIGVNDILKSQNSYHYLRPRLASLHRTR
jgi:predicted component of type VI protein secretion system